MVTLIFRVSMNPGSHTYGHIERVEMTESSLGMPDSLRVKKFVERDPELVFRSAVNRFQNC
jgi:hypothetical protein